MKNIINLVNAFYKYAGEIEDTDMQKSVEDADNRRTAKNKLDRYVKSFLEQLLDSKIGSAPQDIDKIVVDFVVNVKISDLKPVIKMKVTGNSTSVQSWAQKQIKPNMVKFVKDIKQILTEAKATEPFDSDFNIQRVYE